MKGRLTIKYLPNGLYYSYDWSKPYDKFGLSQSERNFAITALFRLASGEEKADFERAASLIWIESPPSGTKTIVCYVNEWQCVAHTFNRKHPVVSKKCG